MKVITLSLLFIVSLNTQIFSQNTTSPFEKRLPLEKVKEIIMDDFELSEQEFNDAWETLPDLNDSQLKELQKSCQLAMYLPDNSTLFFKELDEYYPKELDFSLDLEDSQIFWYLFAYKYQEYLYANFEQKLIGRDLAFLLDLDDVSEKKLNEYLNGKQLDILGFQFLYLLGDIEIDFFFDAAWSEVIDINMSHSNKTYLDFITNINELDILSEDSKEILEDIKYEIISDYGAKRFENLNSENQELEIIAYKKKEEENSAIVNAEANAVAADYIQELNAKYQVDKLENGSPEQWYVYARMNYDLFTYAREVSRIYSKSNAASALKYAEKAIELAPENYHYNYIKALALEINGEKQEAYKLMEEFITKTDTASVLNLQLWSHNFHDLKDYGKALNYINNVVSISTKSEYLTLLEKTKAYNYYNDINISSLKTIKIPLNIPDIPWNNTSLVIVHAMDDKILVDFNENRFENGEISESSLKGIIFDLQGNVVKNHGNWEFQDFVFGKPQNGAIPIIEKLDDFKANYKFINSSGETVLTVASDLADYWSYGLDNFNNGYAIFTDCIDKRITIFDKNFKKISHNFVWPDLNLGDGFFGDDIVDGCKDAVNYKLVSLNGRAYTDYLDNNYPFSNGDIFGNYIYYRPGPSITDGKLLNINTWDNVIDETFTSNEIIIDKDGAKIAILSSKQSHYLFNSKTGVVSNPLPRKKHTHYTGEEWPGSLGFINSKYLSWNNEILNLDSFSKVKPNYFEYIYSAKDFREVSYADASFYSGEQCLLDENLSKIELPNPEAIIDHLTGEYYIAYELKVDPKWNNQYREYYLVKVIH